MYKIHYSSSVKKNNDVLTTLKGKENGFLSHSTALAFILEGFSFLDLFNIF